MSTTTNPAAGIPATAVRAAQRRRGRALGLLLIVAVLAGLALAGCGGAGADPGIATAGGTPSAGASSASPGSNPKDGDLQEQALKYAKCMRENGVPDFPDPEVDGGRMGIRMPEGTDRAKAEAANEACKDLLPNAGEPGKADPERLEQMRKVAKCMRENGVPNFPDPSEDGGIRIDGDKLGMDPRGEKFKEAERLCSKFRPGPPGEGGNQSRTESGGDA